MTTHFVALFLIIFCAFDPIVGTGLLGGGLGDGLGTLLDGANQGVTGADPGTGALAPQGLVGGGLGSGVSTLLRGIKHGLIGKEWGLGMGLAFYSKL